MTVVQCPVQHVRLALQHADPVIKLVEDAKGLITGGIVGAGEHGIVGGDFRDIAVFAGTKFDIVVAWLGVDRCGGGSAGARG